MRAWSLGAIAVVGVLSVAGRTMGPAHAETKVRVRTSADLADCVRAAIGDAAGVVVLSGDPRDTSGADVIVGDEDALGRTLESGAVDMSAARELLDRPVGDRTSTLVVAAVRGSAVAADARRVVDRLFAVRASLATCLGGEERAEGRRAGGGARVQAGTSTFALAVTDWWLPECTLERNGYNDPNQVLGAPDAAYYNEKDVYSGMMSLGQGGYVTVDMGRDIPDGPGADIRVYQVTSKEPVSVYAASDPSGPFTRIALRLPCGRPNPDDPGDPIHHHCDVDLADGALAKARYFKIEDGEIYPCLSGDTKTEGADIDAVEWLNP